MSALAAALALGAAAAATPVAYQAEQVGTVIAASEHVGRVRAGLLCLPKGPLRWRDVGVAERLDGREIVDEALAAEGLGVQSLRRGDTDARRLRGTVTKAAFDLCARNWGLGSRDALSGTGALEVSWRVEAVAAGAEIAHVSHVERTIARGDAASAPEIYRDLLGDAARDLARWLKGGGQP